MLTRHIHAFDESAAVEKLRELVADGPDHDCVVIDYRVCRVKRTLWQRFVGDHPRWKVDYSLNSKTPFESPQSDIVGEQTTAEPTALAAGFTSDSRLEPQPEASAYGSLDPTILSDAHEIQPTNLQEAPKEFAQGNKFGVGRRIWQWFFKKESSRNEEQLTPSMQQIALPVELKDDAVEKLQKEANANEQENARSDVMQVEEENRTIYKPELPSRDGWVSLVDTVFSDFDPKR